MAGLDYRCHHYTGFREHIESRLIRLGALFISISMVGLIYAMPSGLLWLIALLATLMGIGFGMSWTFVSKRIIANVTETECTQASGSIPTFLSEAMALGSALSGIIATHRIFRGKQRRRCPERSFLELRRICSTDACRTLFRLARQS